ncbi:hypothetical protein G3I62_01795 [Streptomyces sp. SID14446]|uniref:DUF6461 domain-containing protein n=1 Tax=Streptomyces sp. SID14446 TaxID=2706072 RepID=UPI0013B6C05F|nr:DUF6461 domain-containing protein [Streptomyces sp. SID14446]NEB27854.1 hypothetical protein [Streptomyces sp. SID14446]
MNASIFPNSDLYETGYCVMFVRAISPTEALSRIPYAKSDVVDLGRSELEAIKALGSEVDQDDVPGVDFDDLESSGILDSSGPLLRSGSHAAWTFIVEPEGPFLAREEVLIAVSRGTSALLAQMSETAAAWISYAEDGEILSSFDPLFPDSDYGKQPAALEDLTGYRKAIDSGERADAYENSLRQIQESLECAMPPAVDSVRLPSVRVPDGY